MKSLRQIWDDIRQGENIDLYLTILAAFVFVILNLAGLTPDTVLAPLTLSVLALLAVTNLVNRHRMEGWMAQKDHTLDDFFREEFPASYKTDFENATEVWLVGVSLNRTVKSQYLKLEQKLKQGHRVRVLLVHPQGPALEMAVERGYTRRDVEMKRQEIISVLNLLDDLRAVAPDRLEVRTIQHPLNYGAMTANPDATNGALYLEHYCFRVTTESIPRYVLRTTDGRWYDFFKTELRTLWEAGDVWGERE
ncbi:MAG: hypothetical protein HUU38_16280 [Anaerolineales bacterium]|nr:hypothetical protein [Anaerolineales bacterium]